MEADLADDGKDRLEGNESQRGDAAVGRDSICGRLVAVDGRVAVEQVAEAEVLERVTDQPVPGLTESLAVSPENPRRH